MLYIPCLSVVFLRLVRLFSFPACLETSQCHPIPNGPPSFSLANYRPIYITSVLSKMFERLVYVRLGRYLERSGVLPTTQFAYRKGLGTCKGKVYYGQEPLSGESITTECGFNYQLLAVIY